MNKKGFEATEEDDEEVNEAWNKLGMGASAIEDTNFGGFGGFGDEEADEEANNGFGAFGDDTTEGDAGFGSFGSFEEGDKK